MYIYSYFHEARSFWHSYFLLFANLELKARTQYRKDSCYSTFVSRVGVVLDVDCRFDVD